MFGEIGLFIIAGFIAQLIDGALGMAYGVSCNTFLLSLGITPAVASASVHLAEIFTSGISGFSHFKFGNVNKKLFLRLLAPGVLGGITGAYFLTQVRASIIKPFVTVYLAAVGTIILIRLCKRTVPRKRIKNLGMIAFFGGFMDATGGGGWGPIVTSTLVANGRNPRYAIGSANTAEFFVALAETVTFFVFLGLVEWRIVLGLIIGGAISAPLAAFFCKKIHPRTLMGMVGGLILILSIRTFLLAFP